MKNTTKIEDKIEGSKNFQAWEYIVLLILEEHDLEDYAKGKLAELEGDEAVFQTLGTLEAIFQKSIETSIQLKHSHW